MNPLEKFQLLYKKEHNNQLSAGFWLIFIGIILVIIFDNLAFAAGIGISFIGLILLFSNIFRPSDSRHPVFLALKDNPEKITHFYLKDFKGKLLLMHLPLGKRKETRLLVRLDNKKTYNMPVKDDWYIIRELFREKCPDASENP